MLAIRKIRQLLQNLQCLQNWIVTSWSDSLEWIVMDVLFWNTFNVENMIAKVHHIHDVEFSELRNQWMINYVNHRFVAHMGKVLFAISIMNE